MYHEGKLVSIYAWQHDIDHNVFYRTFTGFAIMKAKVESVRFRQIHPIN